MSTPARTRSAKRPSRVTTFELFFDLVFVFAFTQVIRLLADTHSPVGVLQALVVLGIWTVPDFSDAELARRFHAGAV